MWSLILTTGVENNATFITIKLKNTGVDIEDEAVFIFLSECNFLMCCFTKYFILGSLNLFWVHSQVCLTRA